ncbi:hypothetical protein HYPSUDRAFT_201165 [Hypholoma sublateritium FD-334 SS-4]|uniref:Uncharacterized protein n=1 Tax=Hypholoma sublateritium (strain FD-334 SS-4) TaxID=945553 RepID=A0A0D2L971_HYPSF|nr:hypothetical protein HYPSUDRAFT_201165 [Hypholoma sublateritium FD-334 SS-4]
MLPRLISPPTVPMSFANKDIRRHPISFMRPPPMLIKSLAKMGRPPFRRMRPPTEPARTADTDVSMPSQVSILIAAISMTAALADVASAAYSLRVPVSQFGGALLRGMSGAHAIRHQIALRGHV